MLRKTPDAYIYVNIYVDKKATNVFFQLLLIHQWPHGNLCAWAYDAFVQTVHQVYELSWDHWQIGNNQESLLFVFLTTYIFRSLYFC